MSADGSKRRTAGRPGLLAALAVVAAAVLPYAPTIDDYFIRDDFGVVQLLASKPGGYFPRWFHTSWMDFIWGYTPDEIRPFPAVSYQLTALPGAAEAWAHHAFNLALHAANGLLVLAMGVRVARLPLAAAALAAVVFVLLPVNAETAAWITGRVDSMPAFFYVTSFLLYAGWRERAGDRARYVASIAAFFVALFTKQTAITMVATLVAADALLVRAPAVSFRKRAAGYLPFAVLTAAYMLLRLALFGHVAREDTLTREGLGQFFVIANRHLAHVVTGDPEGSRALVWAAVALACVLCALARGARRPGLLRAALFFGPVWWAIGVTPVVVAGYESPRHVYLAAMGWAVLVALAAEGAWFAVRRRAWRRGVIAAAAACVAAYALPLAGVVGRWGRMAAVSERGVRTIERESRVSPAGALIVAGVPDRSWEWAVPFALRPPFAGSDITARSFVVTPRALHCCRQQWLDDTRRTLSAWASGPAPDAVIAFRLHPYTGVISRTSTAESPALPAIARQLGSLSEPDLLDSAVRRLLASIGETR